MPIKLNKIRISRGRPLAGVSMKFDFRKAAARFNELRNSEYD